MTDKNAAQPKTPTPPTPPAPSEPYATSSTANEPVFDYYTGSFSDLQNSEKIRAAQSMIGQRQTGRWTPNDQAAMERFMAQKRFDHEMNKLAEANQYGELSDLQDETLSEYNKGFITRAEYDNRTNTYSTIRKWQTGQISDVDFTKQMAQLEKDQVSGPKLVAAPDKGPKLVAAPEKGPQLVASPNTDNWTSLPQNGNTKVSVNGKEFNSYVPDFSINDSNADFSKNGWVDAGRTITINNTTFDFPTMISGISIEDIEDFNVSSMNKIDKLKLLGGLTGVAVLDGLNKAVQTKFIQIIPQTNGKEERVIIQYGSGKSTAKEYAGETIYFSDLKSDGTLGQKMLVQDMIRRAFPELDQSKTYDIAITYDKNHAWDPTLGYLSYENGSYVLTPKLYENDNIILLQYSGVKCNQFDIRHYLETPHVLNEKESAEIEQTLTKDKNIDISFK